MTYSWSSSTFRICCFCEFAKGKYPQFCLTTVHFDLKIKVSLSYTSFSVLLTDIPFVSNNILASRALSAHLKKSTNIGKQYKNVLYDILKIESNRKFDLKTVPRTIVSVNLYKKFPFKSIAPFFHPQLFSRRKKKVKIYFSSCFYRTQDFTNVKKKK